MKTNLRYKFLFILGVILLCMYGIIGLPKSKDELIANWHERIHLGLDLSGGTYLVIQVQQQDAFNQEASTDADRLKEAARKANIPVSEVNIDEAKSIQDAKNVAIVVKGVPSTHGRQLPQLGELSNWANGCCTPPIPPIIGSP